MLDWSWLIDKTKITVGEIRRWSVVQVSSWRRWVILVGHQFRFGPDFGIEPLQMNSSRVIVPVLLKITGNVCYRSVLTSQRRSELNIDYIWNRSLDNPVWIVLRTLSDREYGNDIWHYKANHNDPNSLQGARPVDDEEQPPPLPQPRKKAAQRPREPMRHWWSPLKSLL